MNFKQGEVYRCKPNSLILIKEIVGEYLLIVPVSKDLDYGIERFIHKNDFEVIDKYGTVAKFLFIKYIKRD
jgi:hypothetical protein